MCSFVVVVVVDDVVVVVVDGVVIVGAVLLMMMMLWLLRLLDLLNVKLFLWRGTGGGRDPNITTFTTRKISALRWTAMRTILMLH